MDVEKTMQFILEQQTHFGAGLQQMREAEAAAHAALEAEQKRLSETQSTQQEILGGVIRVVAQLATGQQGLVEAQKRTEERVQELSARVQDVTDNMNALIKVVDDLVRRDGQRP